MEVWEYVDEGGWVVLLQAVPQVLQHRQHDVHAVAQVQSNQDVTEAVSGLNILKFAEKFGSFEKKLEEDC